jgi:hypothetical protein
VHRQFPPLGARRPGLRVRAVNPVALGSAEPYGAIEGPNGGPYRRRTMTEHHGGTHNTDGSSDADVEADTASGGAPEEPDTTEDDGTPVENPSGG